MHRVVIATALGVFATASVHALPTGNANGGAAQQRSCPYDFRSQMPAGEYCVYRGVIASPAGAVCNAEALLIWSTHGEPVEAGAPTDASVAPGSDVFFGFVHAPSLVMHGIAARRTQARLLGYTEGSGEMRVPLDGVATLLRGRAGSGALDLSLRGAPQLVADDVDCSFGAYSGQFIGVMRYPGTGVASSVVD